MSAIYVTIGLLVMCLKVFLDNRKGGDKFLYISSIIFGIEVLIMLIAFIIQYLCE